MGQLFQQALLSVRDRQSLLESQRLWILQRDDRCNAVADSALWSCLLEVTISRAKALAKISPANVEVVATPSATTVQPSTSQTRFEVPSTSTTNVVASTSSTSKSNLSTDPSSTEENSTSLIPIILAILGSAVGLHRYRSWRRKRRLAMKYGEEIAALIVAGRAWQGMTEEQLTESWGSPVDVTREVIRTKTKETWKYGQTGRNRFTNRIYLENGVVIGWLER